ACTDLVPRSPGRTRYAAKASAGTGPQPASRATRPSAPDLHLCADRCDQGVQLDAHQINTGERDGDLPRQHHSCAKQPIEEIDQRDGLRPGLEVVQVAPQDLGHGPSSTAKEYAGHGPRRSSRTAGCSSSSSWTAARNTA